MKLISSAYRDSELLLWVTEGRTAYLKTNSTASVTMSTQLGSTDSKITTESEVDSSMIISNEFRERSKDGQDLTHNANAIALNTDHAKKFVSLQSCNLCSFP